MTFKQKLKFEVKSQVKKVDHSQKYVHVHLFTGSSRDQNQVSFKLYNI